VSRAGAVQNIGDTAVKYWSARPAFATKASTFLLFMEVGGAVAEADPASTSLAARGGRLWCTALTGWPDDDAQRAECKKWCDDFVEALKPFQVTTYLNNAMPASETDMLAVFPETTMRRLNALKKKHDPENLFKTGAWQYEANLWAPAPVPARRH